MGEYPPETEKIVVEKCAYFREVYKMKKVQGDGMENGKEVHFRLRFSYLNFKIFSKLFNLHWFMAQTRKNWPLGFLITFRIIKEFH